CKDFAGGVGHIRRSRCAANCLILRHPRVPVARFGKVWNTLGTNRARITDSMFFDVRSRLDVAIRGRPHTSAIPARKNPLPQRRISLIDARLQRVAGPGFALLVKCVAWTTNMPTLLSNEARSGNTIRVSAIGASQTNTLRFSLSSFSRLRLARWP